MSKFRVMIVKKNGQPVGVRAAAHQRPDDCAGVAR